MAELVSQEVRKHRALEGIASACRQQEMPQSLIDAIVEEAERLIECSDIGDPVKDRQDLLIGYFRKTCPELWLAHKQGLERFASELAEREPSRWGYLCLSAGFMNRGFIHYVDNEGRVDVKRTDELLEAMEAKGLIDIEYVYEEESEDEEEGEWVDIEKSDIPAPGEVGISPLTGKPDPFFHDKVIRHFKIGKPVLALCGEQSRGARD